jgi:molybdenum cofactor synthesis domain-containing protein
MPATGHDRLNWTSVRQAVNGLFMTKTVTAAVLVIGDEILSGRTQDTNLRSIAAFLNPLGVELREARVVGDTQEAICAALDDLRTRWTYVFTTGGIGPTHDDITADAVAAAFGRPITERTDALALLEAHYASRGLEMNEGRRRMARIPDGAGLIANPVSAAPGFQIENVFVLAGVPAVMRGMLEDIAWRIRGGEVVHSRTVRASGLREADIAASLGGIASAYPDMSVGSYPFMRPGAGGALEFGVNLVVRGRDLDRIAHAVDAICAIARTAGAAPEIEPVNG